MDHHRKRQCRIAGPTYLHGASVDPSHHAVRNRDRVHPVDGDCPTECVADLRGVRSAGRGSPAVRHAGRQSISSSTRHVHDAAAVARRPLQSLLVDVLRPRCRESLLQTPADQPHPTPPKLLWPRSQCPRRHLDVAGDLVA